MIHSANKGKRAERDVARALTRSGIPAKRHVRTGDRFTADEGDLRLTTAPVTIEVKDWARGYSRGQVTELLEKLERQKRPGDLGLLVCKRVGHADPYGWDCWVTAQAAGELLMRRGDSENVLAAAFEHPVGLVFGDVIRALVSGGWVTEITNPFEKLETS